MKKLLIALTMALLAATPAAAGEISLAVAASLKEAVNELADKYARKNPGVRFTRNYGGSGALAKQIENGAPADIFIAANTEWLEYLQGKKLLERSGSAVLAYNSLVFAGPADKKVASMKDLSRLERIAIGSPKSVPAGDYAVTALEKAGLATALKAKLVMAKDVRECLMYAERGEVDGAFVYRTDALLARTVAILFTVPPQLYPPVTYPVAQTLSGAGNADAVAFLAYLQGPTGRAVLEKYGFMTK